ncbi:hypothetical protein FRB95_000740, partial [Tulasnella sp. JGI-2019a]
PEDLSHYGTEQGALNHDLEIIVGPHDKGPVQFPERGPSLGGVVPLLKYIDGTSKEQGLLIKWGDDLTEAAKAACLAANHVIPPFKWKAKATEKRTAEVTEQENVGIPGASTNEKR